MAQLQDIWNKLNPRERLTAGGAGVVVLAWLVGVVARGFGLGSIALVGAIAVLAVLYLKYAPNQNITWPVDVSIIVLAISAIIALLALLTLLDWLGYIGGLSVTGTLSLLLYVVGAGIMVWGAWQEYQIVKPAMPNFGSTTTSTPPPAAPSAPPPASTPPAPPVDNTDEAPPA
jgi:multisubunit Na+/H+ antiporter MnhG subunit